MLEKIRKTLIKSKEIIKNTYVIFFKKKQIKIGKKKKLTQIIPKIPDQLT